MGYRCDFSGTIRAVCSSPNQTLALATEIDGEEDRFWFLAFVDAVDNVVELTIKLFETWYECEDDVKDLVGWLARHEGVTVSGDVNVAGEDSYDLWRVHIVDGVVTTQRGRVVYDDM